MQKISVLLSVYHKEKPEYLKLALESIWNNQTVKPSQIVIVKDGELTNELDNILDLFSQFSPIDFVINPHNMGLSTSLNRGLEKCKYEWVARMDTDDIAMPNRFEAQLRHINSHPEVDIIGSYAIKIDEKGVSDGILKVPTTNDDITKYIWTCPMIHPSVMFRKTKILEIGSYNPNSGPRQDDYELWFRCAVNGLRFANIPEPLLQYRFFADSIKKNNTKVGWHRFKTGYRGCRKLHSSPYAYIGITLPLIRSILPYPLNVKFQRLMDSCNPRNK